MKIKPKIFITGASGMLGFELANFFSKKGFEVIALYYSRIGKLRKIRDAKKLKMDITESKFSNKARQYIGKDDVIIHCAAMTEVNKCELNKKQCFKANVLGTKNIVKLARIIDAKLIYISTPFVFDGKKGNYREGDATNPKNYYAQTKLTSEKEALKYRNSLVVRANPIGIRSIDAHPSFIQWFVEMAKNNRSFTLFSDVFTNPISTKGLGVVILSMLTNFPRGVLHIGSSNVVNKAEIWYYILTKFPKYSGKVTLSSVDDTVAGKIANRPKNMSLNIKKAERLGYVMPFWKNEVKFVLKQIGI